MNEFVHLSSTLSIRISEVTYAAVEGVKLVLGLRHLPAVLTVSFESQSSAMAAYELIKKATV